MKKRVRGRRCDQRSIFGPVCSTVPDWPVYFTTRLVGVLHYPTGRCASLPDWSVCFTTRLVGVLHYPTGRFASLPDWSVCFTTQLAGVFHYPTCRCASLPDRLQSISSDAGSSRAHMIDIRDAPSTDPPLSFTRPLLLTGRQRSTRRHGRLSDHMVLTVRQLPPATHADTARWSQPEVDCWYSVIYVDGNVPSIICNNVHRRVETSAVLVQCDRYSKERPRPLAYAAGIGFRLA